MKRKYPVIDIKKTGQNIKQIMQMKGFSVKDIQEYLELSTPQSIYHWFDGRNLPTMDNLYALSELFRIPVDAMLIGNRRFENTFVCANRLIITLPFDEDFLMRALTYYMRILDMQAA